MNNKTCIGQWDNCPEAITKGLCRKSRACTIETECMKEFIKLRK